MPGPNLEPVRTILKGWPTPLKLVLCLSINVLITFSKLTLFIFGIFSYSFRKSFNIFFEVLGETGFGGLFFFSSIILHTLRSNKKTRSIKGTESKDISSALSQSILIYCVGGFFVGIAFYPWIYYIYGVSIALNGIEEDNE